MYKKRHTESREYPGYIAWDEVQQMLENLPKEERARFGILAERDFLQSTTCVRVEQMGVIKQY